MSLQSATVKSDYHQRRAMYLLLLQDKAAPSFNTFNTHNSSTATDTTFDINAFLSHTSKKTVPAALNVVSPGMKALERKSLSV